MQKELRKLLDNTAFMGACSSLSCVVPGNPNMSFHTFLKYCCVPTILLSFMQFFCSKVMSIKSLSNLGSVVLPQNSQKYGFFFIITYISKNWISTVMGNLSWFLRTFSIVSIRSFLSTSWFLVESNKRMLIFGDYLSSYALLNDSMLFSCCVLIHRSHARPQLQS